MKRTMVRGVGSSSLARLCVQALWNSTPESCSVGSKQDCRQYQEGSCREETHQQSA